MVPVSAVERFWQNSSFSTGWLLLRELGDEQLSQLIQSTVATIIRGTGTHHDQYGHKARDVTFEAFRRGMITNADLEAITKHILTDTGRFFDPLKLLNVPQAAGPGSSREDPTVADVAAAIVQAMENLQLHAPAVSAWFAACVAVMNPLNSDFFNSEVLLVWAAIADTGQIQWFAERCLANAERFAKLDRANELSRNIALALVGRSDGDAVIDTLIGLCKKKKRIVTAFENAKAKWSAQRALVPPTMDRGTKQAAPKAAATTPDIDFGRTPSTLALAIVTDSDDPMALLSRAIASTDPVAVLNAMQIPMLYGRANRATKHLPWTASFVEAGLRSLEKLYTLKAPDRKALDVRIGGTSAKNIYYEFMQYFRENWNDKRTYDAFVKEVIVPLYQTTRNERVKWWFAGVVERYAPTLVEADRAKIVRIATELATTGARGSINETLIFVGDKVPGKNDINRLFGPAIGVAAARWPMHGKKKMQHVITLETKYLGSSEYADRDIAAIAVFVSDLSAHQAFAPGTSHVAIIELTTAQLSKGAKISGEGNRIDDGRILEPVTVALPSAVFKGGKKTGALFELRKALDGAVCIQPNRSPRWIQTPQHIGGTFLFDLDDDIAGELNMGDNGHFFVFADTAFIQSK
jgi:hypothetical protein